MITLHQNNWGKQYLYRWAERDGKIIATISHHPRWKQEKLPDAWNVCWMTGRVDWHNTLAEARDNALKGLTSTFVVHTYGADTPHRNKRYLPLRVKATSPDQAWLLAQQQRPQSHLYMCLPLEGK